MIAFLLALLAVVTVQVTDARAAVMPETASPAVARESTPLCSPECEVIIAPTEAASGLEYEGSGPGGGFTPQELRKAYGLPEHGGRNATIAVIDERGDPEAEADLAVYREHFGLPECTAASGCFRQLNEFGDPRSPTAFGSWTDEISLDLDMVTSACPECRIDLYEAAGTVGLREAIDTAVEEGATVVTNSWNLGFEEGNPANAAACEIELCVSQAEEELVDRSLDHPGVPILFSGGDYGYGVRFPADSPYVISVGGTRLLRDPETSRGWSEEVWSNPAYGRNRKGRGTGSGCSIFEEKPTWQTDSPCARRIENDISADADPRSPVSVYDSDLGGWTVGGGTSAAAPFVAGIEGLSSGRSRELGAQAFWQAGESGSLFDVTTGDDGECAPPAEDAYWCTAGVGFDAPTGWGTPNGPLELSSPPLVTAAPVGAIEARAAVLNARVDDEGVAGGASCAFQVTASTDPSFSAPVAEVPCEPNPVEPSAGPIAVSATASGLSPHSSYLFRAVAANADGGPVYGGGSFFTTLPEPPSASIQPALGVTRHEAELRASVDNEGAPDGTSCSFEVTTEDDPKFFSVFETIPCEPDVVTGDGLEEVGASLSGLEQNSGYLYRVVVSSSGGSPLPSASLGFSTLPPPPGATTELNTGVTSDGATLFGVVDDEGDADGSSCRFEVAVLADPEFASPVATVPCEPEAVFGDHGFEVSASVSGLAPDTGYRYRVEATNRGGTTFGDGETFQTAPAPVPLRRKLAGGREAR